MVINSAAVRIRTSIRLRDATLVQTGVDGETRLVCPSQATSLGVLTPLQHTLLADLDRRCCDEGALIAAALARTGGTGIRDAYVLLAQLRRGNWLHATLEHDGRRLLTVSPLGRPAAADPPSALDAVAAATGQATEADRPLDNGPLVLSRFALLRRDGDWPLLESPRSAFGVRIHEPALGEVLGALAMPGSPRRAPLPAGLSAEAVAAAIGTLVACHLVVPVGSTEDTDLELAQWSPHELWFHAHNGRGRQVSGWGATYWAKGRFDPLPVRRAPVGGAVVQLPVPDLAAISAADQRLTEVLETRRSIRRHDDTAPLAVHQLGEFLYRTARTRRTWVRDGVELADRPYPSGGALHELELYPVVGLVTGIPSGLYHYDGHAHRLELVAPDGPLVRRLAGRAGATANMTSRPQVLIMITARFGRVMWKYQSMGYALTLKNVGVLFSVMYCVATAMRLAPCALGGGDADLFGRVAGLDHLNESAVGEFLLGSAPPTPDNAPHHASDNAPEQKE